MYPQPQNPSSLGRVIDRVVSLAASWPGVTVGPERRLDYAGRAFGYVRPEGTVELVFHPRVAAMLVETGRAQADEATGRLVFRVTAPADVDEALELLRLAYERARVAANVRRVDETC